MACTLLFSCNELTNFDLVTASDGLGHYNFQRLAAGQYLMSVTADGFSAADGMVVNAQAGRTTTRNVQLQIAVVEQQVQVLAGAVIDVEPSNNAGALTISGKELQTVTDDPDDLAPRHHPQLCAHVGRRHV